MIKFDDLGRATRRGIKKCIKCGVYNGTKSIACKNKQCDMIFKDSSEKRRIISDAVQLITGNLRKLYSVRVRDQGPDYRGFVQLPLIDPDVNTDTSTQFSEVALCFVDNCPRLFQGLILHYHQIDNHFWSNANSCPHISASLKSRMTATPLTLQLHLILKLRISRELKHTLWSLAHENNIPIVQRVSKNVMAVKCQVTPKHPLGYLHFTFNTGRNKERGAHFCGCSDIVPTPKCIHFYLCICALASDPKYVYEFSNILEQEFEEKINMPCSKLNSALESKVEAYVSKSNMTLIGGSTIAKTRKRKNKTITKLNTSLRKIWPKVYPIQIKIMNNEQDYSCQKNNPVWSFDNWLPFVVESMNRLMVFENAGILNNLTFDIPLDFYKTLRNKVPQEYLNPIESTLEYEIMHIMNISHVKQTFNNSKIKLKVSKRFILDENGSYVEIDENYDSTGDLMPHFIYFLNVGQLTVDDSDNTNNSFILEWILSSETNVGQLKLQYKYGRKCL